jgi:4'-phosphopantetheinyl transferase EntD
MIEEILPSCVAACEVMGDLPGVLLFPQEEALLAGAADKRRHEFATARTCARTALGRLGVTPAPILNGRCGALQWPAGVVGSITHCAGYRAAAVAWKHEVMAIGIDAEPHLALPDGVLAAVATDADLAHLAVLAAAQPRVCWDRLLFCAKEAVFKAWFPLAGRWLDFADASVEFDPAAATFAARLLVKAQASDRRSGRFTGRWLVRDGLVITVIAATATPDAGHHQTSIPSVCATPPNPTWGTQVLL